MEHEIAKAKKASENALKALLELKEALRPIEKESTRLERIAFKEDAKKKPNERLYKQSIKESDRLDDIIYKLTDKIINKAQSL